MVPQAASDSYDCLIVDDEAALSESTREYFTMFGLRTAWAATAAECFEFLAAHPVGVILLDINLGGPGGDSGFQVCKQLRQTTDVPILFISARGSDDDVLLALGVGGDDYVTKPYSLSVLLAKVQAVLKRYRGGAASGTVTVAAPALEAAVPPSAADQLAFGPYTLRFDQERLYGPDGEVALTGMEYRLLAYLARNDGRVVPKRELFTKVWGTAFTGDGTLNVHIRRLREKLGDGGPGGPQWIKTAWGTGYLFEAAPAAPGTDAGR
ncbi:MAG: response regulator transcription factor [Bifidobacteriaceae bacterium]|jgi:two-component system response regulator RegX3|nr:response regulator transcription factor [Bifidobacteriaceae bacterium]